MKRFLGMFLCLSILTGCAAAEDLEYYSDEPVYIENEDKIEREKSYTYLIERKQYDKYDPAEYNTVDENGNPETNKDLFFDNYWFNDNKEKEEFKKNVLSVSEEDVLKQAEEITDIKIIQHNRKEVKIYRDKDYGDIFFLSEVDGENEKERTDRYDEKTNPFTRYPENYKEIVRKAEKDADLWLSFCKTGGAKDNLTFCNKEGLLFFTVDLGVIFNVNYDDVDFVSDNAPLKMFVYFENGKLSNIKIAYADIKYNSHGFSQRNYDEIKSLINIIGFDGDGISDGVRECMDGGKSNFDGNGFSIVKNDSLKDDFRYSYGQLEIDFEN